MVRYRALLAVGGEEDRHVNDVDHLRDVLAGSTNWTGANATVETDYNPAASALVDNIKEFFKGADDDDVSLFFFADHGCKDSDGECTDNIDADGDEPGGDDPKCGDDNDQECDEDIRTGEFLADNFILDDDLDEPFKTFGGNKTVVLEACFSGGMKDGSADLPVDNSTVLTASNTNQPSFGNPKTPNHAHDWFSAALIAGLADNGDGFARADVHGDLPETGENDAVDGPSKQRDGKVTLLEWFDYANGLVQGLTDGQDPEINDNKEAAANKRARKVIFAYANPGDPNNSLRDHEVPARAAPDRGACFERVGGVAEPVTLTDDALASPSGGSGSSAGAVGAVAGGAAAAVVVAVAGGWYARRIRQIKVSQKGVRQCEN